MNRDVLHSDSCSLLYLFIYLSFFFFVCYGPDDVLTSVWNVCGGWWRGMCHVPVTVFPPLYRSPSKRVPVGRVTEHHTLPTHLYCKIYSHLHLRGARGGGGLKSVKTWLYQKQLDWNTYNLNVGQLKKVHWVVGTFLQTRNQKGSGLVLELNEEKHTNKQTKKTIQ